MWKSGYVRGVTRVQYGFGSPQVRGNGSGSVLVRVPIGDSHVRSLWGWILTQAYITKRPSEEEKKERDLVGGQTALPIYSEGRGLHASDPLRVPAPSSRVRLLHPPSPTLLGSLHRLPDPTAYYQLLPPSATSCARARNNRLPPPSATLCPCGP